nr:hypothetical protein [Tanacetum cinerariifolium]
MITNHGSLGPKIIEIMKHKLSHGAKIIQYGGQESRDAIFNEERFTSIPRSRGVIQPSLSKIAKDEVAGTDDVPGLSVPRKSTRTRKAKSFRTTSRSESKKSFFKSFTSRGATLVSFTMSYESALERKRYRQEALDFKTIEEAPKCETKLAIELHATRVYTRTIFLLIQTEINEGCWNCTIQDLKIDEGCETVIIRDKKPNDNRLLFHKKGKKQKKKTKTVGETARDYK